MFFYECSKVSRNVYSHSSAIKCQSGTRNSHPLLTWLLKDIKRNKNSHNESNAKTSSVIEVRNVCVWVVHHLTIYRHQTCHLLQEICHKNIRLFFCLWSRYNATRLVSQQVPGCQWRHVVVYTNRDKFSVSTSILDLYLDFRMLLQLTRRSRSALCGFAASTRANTVLTVRPSLVFRMCKKFHFLRDAVRRTCMYLYVFHVHQLIILQSESFHVQVWTENGMHGFEIGFRKFGH